MASITTRVGKGSPLSTQELDANFTNLNADKLEKSLTGYNAATSLDGTELLPVVQSGETKKAAMTAIAVAVRNYLLDSGADLPYGPDYLFSHGEQGAWYDPSDLTTLFQDSAGTTPVTAVEQPVGLMLDKSKSAVGTNGAKRVNLLTYTEDFQTSYVIAGRPWVIGTIANIPQGEITVNQTIAPDGTTTADLFATKYSNNSAHLLAYSGLTNPGAQITYSVYLKSAGSPYAMVAFYGTNNVYNGILVNLSTGALLDTKGTIDGYSITPSENGFYRVSITGTLNTTSPIPAVLLSNSATPTYDASNRPTFVGTTESIYVWGADLRLASESSTLPLYQPITSSWEATIPGNHASQPTSAARPVLSARYNLLTWSESFDNASVWTSDLTTSVSANQTMAPDGTTTADLISETTANNYHDIYTSVAGRASVTLGAAYTMVIHVKKGPGDTAPDIIQLTHNGVYFGASQYANFNISAGTITAEVGSAPGYPASITNVGNGWFRLSFTAVCTSASASGGLGQYAFVNNNPIATRLPTYVGATTSNMYLWGADLRVANDGVGIPSYQRVAAATDYDTTGFPLYLKFDGVDDCLYTSSINFTATDKMTVWAGVRKLSDATSAVLAEIGTVRGSTTGTFTLLAPGNIGSVGYVNYGVGSHGGVDSTCGSSDSSFASPNTAVLSAISDMPANALYLRGNGLQIASSSSDQGTGNFGNYPLYIGRRNNASLQFNGRIYSFIIRGAEFTETQVKWVETYVNNKAKAY